MESSVFYESMDFHEIFPRFSADMERSSFPNLHPSADMNNFSQWVCSRCHDRFDNPVHHQCWGSTEPETVVEAVRTEQLPERNDLATVAQLMDFWTREENTQYQDLTMELNEDNRRLRNEIVELNLTIRDLRHDWMAMQEAHEVLQTSYDALTEQALRNQDELRVRLIMFRNFIERQGVPWDVMMDRNGVPIMPVQRNLRAEPIAEQFPVIDLTGDSTDGESSDSE